MHKCEKTTNFSKNLGNMTIAARKITYREFREMEFDDNDPYWYELLNGVLVRKSAPHILHQRISKKPFRLLESFVIEKKLGEVFYAPVDVVLSADSAPQPDLMYISHTNAAVLNEEEGVINGAPDLVVEIISPSSVKRDRIEKKALYEKFGIIEYWLVDPNNQSIEIYTLQNNRYELLVFADATESVASKVIAGLEIAASDLFND